MTQNVPMSPELANELNAMSLRHELNSVRMLIRCVVCRSVSKSFKLLLSFKQRQENGWKHNIHNNLLQSDCSLVPPSFIQKSITHLFFFFNTKSVFSVIPQEWVFLFLTEAPLHFSAHLNPMDCLWALCRSCVPLRDWWQLACEKHTLFLSFPLERNRWGLDRMKEIKDEGISLKMETEREEEQ